MRMQWPKRSQDPKPRLQVEIRCLAVHKNTHEHNVERTHGSHVIPIGLPSSRRKKDVEGVVHMYILMCEGD